MSRGALDLLFKGLLGFSSMALSVITWLILDKVSNITNDLKDLNSNVSTMQVEYATVSNTTEVHDRWLTNQASRLGVVESTVSEIKGQLSRRH